jgi:hypothetical protein
MVHVHYLCIVLCFNQRAMDFAICALFYVSTKGLWILPVIVQNTTECCPENCNCCKPTSYNRPFIILANLSTFKKQMTEEMRASCYISACTSKSSSEGNC